MSLLHFLRDYGFDITKPIDLELAAEYVNSLGLNVRPGVKWLNSFIRRHSEDITWKKQEHLERARAEAFTEHIRVGWFKILKEALTKYDLFDKPNQIFNVDESEFSDQTKGTIISID